MIDPARLHLLNDKPVRTTGGFVLYWMQQSQRADWNHALEFAVAQAHELQRPLITVFGLMDDYPDANVRHLAFMFEGLRETFAALEKRGIGVWIRRGHPAEVALLAGKKASLIVCDQGYLRHQAEWRSRVADGAECRVLEVESDAVVPVETASDHAEYMARTLRPKLHKLLPRFLRPLKPCGLQIPRGTSLRAPDGFQKTLPDLAGLKTDHSVGPVSRFRGGASEARRRLETFVARALTDYSAHSNRPETGSVSELSPYLHFGQISPLEVALYIRATDVPDGEKTAFLEQLIVRRELAINMVWFDRKYDSFDVLPQWARTSLTHHATDPRPVHYTREQLIAAKTHDPFWNAAMDEMRETGFMHNYMRMYWGKKIVEWTPSPQEAFDVILELNNRYFLDGRDPNSYAGAAWIFGKHDQAWKERPVFGKVRYMNAAGLKRKSDPDAYIERVRSLIKAESSVQGSGAACHSRGGTPPL